MYYSGVIKSTVWAALAGSIILWIGFQFQSVERTNVHYESVRVVSLGQCSKYDCSFTFMDTSGNLQFGETSDPVSVGQIVYRQCWTTEKSGGRCYVKYSPSK